MSLAANEKCGLGTVSDPSAVPLHPHALFCWYCKTCFSFPQLAQSSGPYPPTFDPWASPGAIYVSRGAPSIEPNSLELFLNIWRSFEVALNSFSWFSLSGCNNWTAFWEQNLRGDLRPCKIWLSPNWEAMCGESASKGDITLNFKLVNSNGGLLHKASWFAILGLLFNML